MDKKRLINYFDPEQKGYISPCDIGRILREWFAFSCMVLLLIFMILLPGSIGMDILYGQNNIPYSFLDYMPWYGLIIWIVSGIFWWLIIFGGMFVLGKGFEFVLDSLEYMISFIKKKTKICKIKLIKINRK